MVRRRILLPLLLAPLLGFLLLHSPAKAQMPAEIQLDLFNEQLTSAFKGRDYERVLELVKGFQKSRPDLAQELAYAEAKANVELGRAKTAHGIITKYLQSAGKSGAHYKEMLALYPEMQKAAKVKAGEWLMRANKAANLNNRKFEGRFELLATKHLDSYFRQTFGGVVRLKPEEVPPLFDFTEYSLDPCVPNLDNLLILTAWLGKNKLESFEFERAFEWRFDFELPLANIVGGEIGDPLGIGSKDFVVLKYNGEPNFTFYYSIERDEPYRPLSLSGERFSDTEFKFKSKDKVMLLLPVADRKGILEDILEAADYCRIATGVGG